MLNNLEQMHLKLLKKENSKSEATGGLAGNIAYKLQKSRELHRRLAHRK